MGGKGKRDKKKAAEAAAKLDAQGAAQTPVRCGAQSWAANGPFSEFSQHKPLARGQGTPASAFPGGLVQTKSRTFQVEEEHDRDGCLRTVMVLADFEVE